MPYKTVGTIKVEYLQIIDEKGEADAGLLDDIPDERIKGFFEAIVLARTFNHRALSLQREGRIGTYASIFGQEASQVASAAAFAGDDWLFPSFRESGVLVARAYPMWMIYRYWMGDERGCKAPEGSNIFPMSVPVGTHLPHATGAAWAMKLKGDDRAAGVYFGDGGSSKGDFHEALNFAGVFKVPVVFLCQNNQWAISVPRASQTAAKTIAQRGPAYGFEGIQVDGNDAVAVYKATKDAVDKAKRGDGPTLIECYTYRLDDHTTADDASRYRSKEEVERWKQREPLIRLRLYLEGKGLWSEEYEAGVTKKAEALVDAEIKKAEEYPPPEPSDIITYTYAEPTRRQRKEMEALGWKK
ncbi:MAG: pyruvate dehydrogenase (acetyl-transferring) E1 component subunit alpha [Thermodesulfobacteriota bacterium]